MESTSCAQEGARRRAVGGRYWALSLGMLMGACGGGSSGGPTGSQPSAFQGPSGLAPEVMPMAGAQAPSVAMPTAQGPGQMPPGANRPGVNPPAVDPPGMMPPTMEPSTMEPTPQTPQTTEPTTMAPSTMEPEVVNPECMAQGPEDFEPNPSIGRGGSQFTDSPHFRIYGSASASTVETTTNHLEAAYSCFVEDWCFRSPGLSVHSDDGPYYKMNIYGVSGLGAAAGVMQYDARAGLTYLEVITSQMALPRVTVHEFGHALTLSEYGWVDQTRTGAWWETVANWVADTYMTSAYCADARERYGIAEGSTIIDLNKVIGQSYLTIVHDQNLYEAWPFIAYLVNNPDGYEGLGRMVLLEMFRNHARNNETPLHVLERVAAPVTVQTILGRYWAHMAYVDIGHAKAQQAFMSARGRLNYANLDAAGGGTYRVKSSRRPMYGGSNIIPLSGTGDISIQVNNLGNGQSDSNFTATLAIRGSGSAVRYVDLPDGSGQASVASGEEATLVVVNTPDTLIQYDAFNNNGAAAVGLNYEVQITGATPSN